MAKNAFEAVVFDLDGVITKTAATHSRAWKKMFDEYLKQRETEHNEPFKEFTSDDYLTFVDGKPRYEGVKSFLDSRGIKLPYGTPDDDLNLETVSGLGNRKNKAFNEVLKTEGVEVYPSTVKLFKKLKENNIHIGVASSSKNCESVLKAAGLMEYIETRVDGVVSAEIGLKGKPAPDIFITAAANLGVLPHKTIVVEDAVSGVQAGKNGNFGLVLGLARENNNQALLNNGADIVLNDLDEISFNELEAWFNHGIDRDNWILEYNNYIPGKEKSREALLSIGNGYFGTRGAMEEISAGKTNYPGTYIAGLYNRLITEISGKDIENEDFVAAPNWLKISFKIDDNDWFNPNECKIESIKRRLDFKTGELTREMIVIDNENHHTLISSKRIASMAKPHQAAIVYNITPLNYSGRITICSQLDGAIVNEGVERYNALNNKHLEPVEQGSLNNTTWIVTQTSQSKILIAEASKIIADNGFNIATTTEDSIAYTYFDKNIKKGESSTIEKLVAIYDSNNCEGNILSQALSDLDSEHSYDNIFSESAKAWKKIWSKVDIHIDGDRIAQKMLRLHIYHLLVSASPHNHSIDASITARGLHGEAYRGHIFWDELFILPFYDIHFPETAKSMLMYRYLRLDKAREYANEYGYKGAMFPWQSGSDGREETQVIHLNPVSGEWGDDYSSLQRHVSLSIAYNIWQYFNITQDIDFLKNYGAEMFLEICRFWDSKTVKNTETGRYSIDNVMGPDEFHESYPDANEGGLRDNAYTNIMVSWMFNTAKKIIEAASENGKVTAVDKISLADEELIRWENISSNLNIVIDKEGIISQYDGYFDLKELDWEYYNNKYADIHRMDRILKAEGKSADDYKVAKQADTLMTFYNLDEEEVNSILKRLNYDMPEGYLDKNLNYYLKRTSHGSTLSRIVHSQLANIIDNKELGWKLYMDALTSDYNDIQGGTTSEGIHAGVMAGTVMLAISTFAGVDLRGDILKINPELPEHWNTIGFNISFKKTDYIFLLSNNEIQITATQDCTVSAFGKLFEIVKNKTITLTR